MNGFCQEASTDTVNRYRIRGQALHHLPGGGLGEAAPYTRSATNPRSPRFDDRPDSLLGAGRRSPGTGRRRRLRPKRSLRSGRQRDHDRDRRRHPARCQHLPPTGVHLDGGVRRADGGSDRRAHAVGGAVGIGGLRVRSPALRCRRVGGDSGRHRGQYADGRSGPGPRRRRGAPGRIPRRSRHGIHRRRIWAARCGGRLPAVQSSAWDPAVGGGPRHHRAWRLIGGVVRPGGRRDIHQGRRRGRRPGRKGRVRHTRGRRAQPRGDRRQRWRQCRRCRRDGCRPLRVVRRGPGGAHRLRRHRLRRSRLSGADAHLPIRCGRSGDGCLDPRFLSGQGDG